MAADGGVDVEQRAVGVEHRGLGRRAAARGGGGHRAEPLFAAFGRNAPSRRRGGPRRCGGGWAAPVSVGSIIGRERLSSLSDKIPAAARRGQASKREEGRPAPPFAGGAAGWKRLLALSDKMPSLAERGRGAGRRALPVMDGGGVGRNRDRPSSLLDKPLPSSGWVGRGLASGAEVI
ncbi:hypothetical protein GCM10009416_34880 [Craurococcus roseus]|uniref:Uncharacterized protein n=1 Tax=Craurococcus roseus TaxID=77585 RepID=A0ABN1FM00_9PROT